MRVAIMQPYVFPYIGYFQLLHAVDVFVFYDDVNFINKGWINRNQLLVNGKASLFTVPLAGASQNKLIKDVALAVDAKWLRKFYDTLEHNYKKAPYFGPVFGLIEAVFDTPSPSISALAMQSVSSICDYLEIDTAFKVSSIHYPDTISKKGSERLLAICENMQANTYINPFGGQGLYSKGYFKKQGVELLFLKSEPIAYSQFDNEFVPWLSILDVLMFNSPNKVRSFLKSYTLS